MTTLPNDTQRRFWAEGPGQHWVRLHRELDTLHGRLTGILLDAADPRPGERVVDIGCGAGAVTLAAKERVGPEGHVLGLDIAEPLIEVGRERAAALDWRPDFHVADAQVWAHEGVPFDLCVSRMGLMFFDDPVAGFANILGHLRPGGRMVFAAWSDAAHNPWFHVAMEEAVARLGPAASSGDPFAPGPTAFRDIGRVCTLLTEAGAVSPRGETVDTVLEVPGGATEAAELTQFVGPISRHLRDMGGDEEDRAAIHAAVLNRFRTFDTDKGCRIPARINLFHAEKP